MSGVLRIESGVFRVQNSGRAIVQGAVINWAEWDGSNNTTPTSFDLAVSEIGATSFMTLDTDKFMVGFTRTDTQNPSAVALTRSGDVISAGAVTILDTDRPVNLNQYRANVSDTDRAIGIYAGDNGATQNRHGRILTVSGTTITANAEVLVNDQNDGPVDLVQLDTNKHLYLYHDNEVPEGVSARVYTNSGTATFTPGSPVTLSSVTNANYLQSAKLPGLEKVVFAYRQASGINLHVISVSGTTATTGATLTVPLSAGATEEVVNLIPIDATHVALIHSGTNSGGTTYIRIYSISGNTLTEELGQTILLNVRLNNNGSLFTPIGQANKVQLNSTDFMIVNRVNATTITNGYIIRFPTPTTFSVLATAQVDGSNALEWIMLQSINATTTIMVNKDPGDSSAIQARLLKL